MAVSNPSGSSLWSELYNSTQSASTGATLVSSGITGKVIRVQVNGQIAAGGTGAFLIRVNGVTGASYQNRYFNATTTLTTGNLTGITMGSGAVGSIVRIAGVVEIFVKAYNNGATANVQWVGGAFDPQNANNNTIAGNVPTSDVTSIEFSSAQAFTGQILIDQR